jgi:YedE family putative selenium metabolism protein
MLPLIMLGFLVLLLIYPQIEGQPKSGVLFYSLKGPGAMHAPLIIALIVGLGIGFLAQRSRFCTMGAIRDVVLFGQTHLLTGFLSLVVFAFLTNLALGQFHPGFAGQPWPTHARLEFCRDGPGRSGLRPGRRLPRSTVVSLR